MNFVHLFFFFNDFFFLVPVLLLVIALIVYPVMFWEDLENKVKQGGHKWQFDWAYGLGWGAVVFLLGAGILLYFERHSEEVDYMEKTTYDNRGRETDA